MGLRLGGMGTRPRWTTRLRSVKKACLERERRGEGGRERESKREVEKK